MPKIRHYCDSMAKAKTTGQDRNPANAPAKLARQMNTLQQACGNAEKKSAPALSQRHARQSHIAPRGTRT
jgi:hypothetical protein